MQTTDIKAHENMKTKHSSYPKLPKFIKNRESPNFKTPNKGLQRAALRGFYDRVNNWYKQNPGL